MSHSETTGSPNPIREGFRFIYETRMFTLLMNSRYNKLLLDLIAASGVLDSRYPPGKELFLPMTIVSTNFLISCPLQRRQQYLRLALI